MGLTSDGLGSNFSLPPTSERHSFLFEGVFEEEGFVLRVGSLIEFDIFFDTVSGIFDLEYRHSFTLLETLLASSLPVVKSISFGFGRSKRGIRLCDLGSCLGFVL